MKSIVERLKENRQVELAKSILESNGYRVTKSEKLNESEVTESSSYSTIRSFRKEDWYGWGGAEKLPSSKDPYIWEDEDYTLLVTGHPDDESKAQVSIYPGEFFDDQISFESDAKEEDDALKLGDQIASELAAGKDSMKLVRQYGLKKIKY